MSPFKSQSEPSGQPAPPTGNLWQPVAIFWREEVRFEVRASPQAGTGHGASPRRRRSGAKCAERLHLKFPGGLRALSHPLRERETWLRDPTRPTQPKIRIRT